MNSPCFGSLPGPQIGGIRQGQHGDRIRRKVLPFPAFRTPYKAQNRLLGQGFHLQRVQVFFLKPIDPEAFFCLLDGFVMGPDGKPALFQEGKGHMVFPVQSRGKVPGHHHVHIIVVGPDGRYPFRVFIPESAAQIKIHQQLDGHPHRIGMGRAQPLLNVGHQLFPVLFKELGAKGIADRPVIYVRQEPLHLFDAAVKVLHAVQKVGMQAVFFVVRMGKILQKCFCSSAPLNALSVSLQFGRPDADHAFRFQIGNQRQRELPVRLIPQGQQVLTNLVDVAVHNLPPFTEIVVLSYTKIARLANKKPCR